MNRKLIIFITMFLMISQAYSIVYTGDDPVLSGDATITPYPVEPGQDFSLQLRVYNTGQGFAKEVTVDYIKNNIFRLNGDDAEFSTPFSICASCSKDNLYYFSVAPDAKSGEYPVSFKINYEGGTVEENIMVRVSGQPDIIFDSGINEEYITPDSKFELELKIKNVGTGTARSLKIVPITNGFVMENSNMIFIDEIRPNEIITKNIKFLVSDSSNPGPQTLKFDLSYKDENSNEYESEQSVGIDLSNVVKLDVSSIQFNPQLIKTNDNLQIVVRIENLGEGEASGIRVELQNNNLKGQKTSYIGKLNEDEDAPAYFSVTTGLPGKSDLKINIYYEDDLGQHMISKDIEMIIMAPGSAKLYVFIILAVILAVSGYYYFFIYRKKQKK